MTYADDERWQDWAAWFPLIRQEISGLMHQRYVWRAMIKMLQSNTEVQHNSIVNGWLIRGYSQTVALGVRRQCDSKGRRPTLGRLLYEIEKHPQVLTQGRFAALGQERGVQQDWTSAWKSLWNNRLQGRAQQDQQRLTAATQATRDWVNWNIAHLDHTKQAPGFTAADLNPALDTLAALTADYYELFNPGMVAGNYTADLPYTWVDMFKAAWLPEGFEIPTETENDEVAKAMRLEWR